MRRGVYILQLEGRGFQPHAIVVDAKGRRVYDKAQPVVLRLSAQILRLLASTGDGELRIVPAREIRAYSRR